MNESWEAFEISLRRISGIIEKTWVMLQNPFVAWERHIQGEWQNRYIFPDKGFLTHPKGLHTFPVALLSTVYDPRKFPLKKTEFRARVKVMWKGKSAPFMGAFSLLSSLKNGLYPGKKWGAEKIKNASRKLIWVFAGTWVISQKIERPSKSTSSYLWSHFLNEILSTLILSGITGLFYVWCLQKVRTQTPTKENYMREHKLDAFPPMGCIHAS